MLLWDTQRSEVQIDPFPCELFKSVNGKGNGTPLPAIPLFLLQLHFFNDIHPGIVFPDLTGLLYHDVILE